MDDQVVVGFEEEPWRPAIASGHLSQLQDLVQEQGLTVLTLNHVNEDEVIHTTPLIEAVRRQHMDMVQYLLEECSSVVDVNDCSNVHREERGFSSLHFATQSNNLDLVRYLVEKGGDVNICALGANDKTALHMAVEGEHVEIAKCLIDTGLCNLDLKTSDRRSPAEVTAFSLAVGGCDDGFEYGECFEIVRYIMERGPWTAQERADRATRVLPGACGRGNLDMIAYLVESCGADAHAPGVDDWHHGLTPLMVACEHGCLEIVHYLVQTCHVNVEVYGMQQKKMNPLLQACEYGHLEVIQFLIEECGANVETTRGGYEDATVLHMAIKSDKLDVVQYVAEKCRCIVEAANNIGYRAIHVAMQFGKVDVIKCLVDTGRADVEGTDRHGNTALHQAARYGMLDVVRLLVEKYGSNVEAKNNDQCTPLTLACMARDVIAVVKYLVEECRVAVDVPNNKGETALHSACERRIVETVLCLVQSGRINVNAVDMSDMTAMQCCLVSQRYGPAADYAEQCLQIAKILATVDGAMFEARDNDGRTLLYLACEQNVLPMAKYLAEECRVDVNSATNMGETALLIASRERHVEVVQYLTRLLRVDVNAADNNGLTALHYACSAVVNEERALHDRRSSASCNSNCCKIVQSLLKTGRVDVNAQDNQGKSALHHSVVNPVEVALYDCKRREYIQDVCFKIVQSLVESGQVNVDITDETGQTVLHYFCSFPNIDIPRYLIEQAHAKFDVMDNDGRTALHSAAFSARGTAQSVELRLSIRLVLFLVNRLSTDLLEQDDVEQHLVPILGDHDGGEGRFEPRESHLKWTSSEMLAR